MFLCIWQRGGGGGGLGPSPKSVIGPTSDTLFKQTQTLFYFASVIVEALFPENNKSPC